VANTLTNLVPDIFAAYDIVARERVGFIPAVFTDASSERAAVNQTVRVPISPAATAENLTPGTNPPDTGDQTFTNTQITISNSRSVPFRWTGEEQKGINSGVGYSNLRQDQIAQALRTLTNEVENDLAALYTYSSRAYGTAGTTPFATADDLTDLTEGRRILFDNGCPNNDLHLVLNSAGLAKLAGKQSILFKANESGSEQGLRTGSIGNILGVAIHDSAQLATHTKGTGASYLLNDASSAIGDTSIATDTGSGTILAGDVVTFAGTTHKYIVNTALSGGTFVINKPGLLVAETDDDAITVGGSYTPNLLFHRNSIVLAARQPELPEEGDQADDVLTLQDPYSGIFFEFAIYKQFRRVRYQVSLAWGVAAIKPEFIATILG